MEKLEPKYGLTSTISLAIGCVIGAGIFFKVDDVLTATNGNILAGLIGWLIVGTSVVSGAIALSYYAQLLPTEGGLLKYGEYRYGKKFSFYVGWFYMTIYYPVLGAVLFTVGSEFLVNLITEFVEFKPNHLHYTLVGTIVAFLLFYINYRSPKTGGLIQSVSTVLKIIPLIIIAALGIVMIISGNIDPENSITSTNSMNNFRKVSIFSLAASSFIPIAFAFDGWYVATQISGEVKNAKRNLPIALIAGTIIVMLIYVFYYLGVALELGSENIIKLGNGYIAHYAETLGGKTGTILMQLAIVISIYGAGNAILIGGLRVPYQLANSGNSKNFFNVLKIDKKTKMPMNSTYFVLALTLAYIVIYYITNTNKFFIDLKFDLSSFPVTFVYVIMFFLFIGLFKLIKNDVFKGNKIIKTIITLIAILGASIVLYGGITTSNGTLYIILSISILAIGSFFIKKTN